jgi:hypothetical protein
MLPGITARVLACDWTLAPAEPGLEGFDETCRLTHWINLLSALDDCIMEILVSSDAE